MEREPLIYRAKTKRKSERTREREGGGREVGARERGETERKRVKGEEGRTLEETRREKAALPNGTRQRV